MWLVSEARIRRWEREHPNEADSMRNWRLIARAANWGTFADVRDTFRSADLVGDFVVFNIAHNRYRLITTINYTTHKVFIRAILAHVEYDRRKLT